MSGPPVPFAEFDYHDREEFAQMYAWAGSCPQLAKLARESGRELKPNTLTVWRARHGIPIVNPDYRLREELARQEPAEWDLPAGVKAALKRTTVPVSIETLADQFNVAPKEVRAALETLEAGSVLVQRCAAGVSLERDLTLAEQPVTVDFAKHKETEIPIGVIADTHLGSKYERLDVLEALFDRFAGYGVRTVYHGGNIIDGESRFNKFDIYAIGVEDQIANLIEKWPQREGIVTRFVTGDDHEGWYVQREHIDIGRRIEQDAYATGRDDLRHLGYMERDIEYAQEGGAARIRVIHAGGGSAYAVSYTSQKYAETLQGGEKPQIVLVGHFHKFDFSYPREVYMVQVGCCQDQTPFMRKRKIQAHVGGCVLWVTQNDLGIFTSVRVQWIPFYDRKFYQYRW